MPRNSPPNSSETTHWQKSSHAGLVKYLPTGGYYARFRSSGKLLWRSLKTKVLSIAVQRLGDLKREQNATKRHRTRITEGTLTMADAAARVLASMEADRSLKPRTKAYYGEILKKTVSVWPNWDATPVTKVTKVDCMEWSTRMAGCSPSVFNHAVGLLRKTLNVGVENGAIYLNHANSIPKARITQRRLILPSFDEFNRFVLAIESSGSGWSQPCADLVRFLAYGGFRRSEAAQISWSDVDQEKGTIHVHGDPQHGTKSGKARQVPIIPEMGTLLQRLGSLRHHGETTDRVMQVRECQKAMDRAAAEVGMVRITHHDLRHLFATRCIESGVDIPTVSRWLGHQDGGALAMKVYGHLRDDHSQEMAKKVSFSAPAEVGAPQPVSVASAEAAATPKRRARKPTKTPPALPQE